MITRLAMVWAVVTALSFAVMAARFETPRFVELDGHGRIPEDVARDLQANGCLDVEAQHACVVAWSEPCADRACLLGDAAWIGVVTAAALHVGMGLRRWLRRRRAGGSNGRRPDEDT